jgi:hypothetical protein
MSETFPEGTDDRTEGEAAPDDPAAERAQEGVQEAFE